MDKDGILIGAELDMFSGFIDIGNKKKNPESDKLINEKEAKQYVNSLDDKSKMYSIDGGITWTKEKPEKDNLPKNTKIISKNGYYDVGSSGELIELFVPVYEIKNENGKKIWTTVKPEDEAKILNTKEINYRQYINDKGEIKKLKQEDILDFLLNVEGFSIDNNIKSVNKGLNGEIIIEYNDGTIRTNYSDGQYIIETYDASTNIKFKEWFNSDGKKYSDLKTCSQPVLCEYKVYEADEQGNMVPVILKRAKLVNDPNELSKNNNMKIDPKNVVKNNQEIALKFLDQAIANPEYNTNSGKNLSKDIDDKLYVSKEEIKQNNQTKNVKKETDEDVSKTSSELEDTERSKYDEPFLLLETGKYEKKVDANGNQIYEEVITSDSAIYNDHSVDSYEYSKESDTKNRIIEHSSDGSTNNILYEDVYDVDGKFLGIRPIEQVRTSSSFVAVHTYDYVSDKKSEVMTLSTPGANGYVYLRQTVDISKQYADDAIIPVDDLAIVEEKIDVKGNVYCTTKNNWYGKKLEQTAKVYNGKKFQTVTVKYDGKGNTKGIVLQNGETISNLANALGCSTADLARLNPQYVTKNKKYIAAPYGSVLTVPGEISATDPFYYTRKTSADVKRQIQDDKAKFEQKQRAKEAEVKRLNEQRRKAAIVQYSQKLINEYKDSGSNWFSTFMESLSEGFTTSELRKFKIKNASDLARVVLYIEEYGYVQKDTESPYHEKLLIRKDSTINDPNNLNKIPPLNHNYQANLNDDTFQAYVNAICALNMDIFDSNGNFSGLNRLEEPNSRYANEPLSEMPPYLALPLGNKWEQVKQVNENYAREEYINTRNFQSEYDIPYIIGSIKYELDGWTDNKDVLDTFNKKVNKTNISRIIQGFDGNNSDIINELYQEFYVMNDKDDLSTYLSCVKKICGCLLEQAKDLGVDPKSSIYYNVQSAYKDFMNSKGKQYKPLSQAIKTLNAVVSGIEALPPGNERTRALNSTTINDPWVINAYGDTAYGIYNTSKESLDTYNNDETFWQACYDALAPGSYEEIRTRVNNFGLSAKNLKRVCDQIDKSITQNASLSGEDAAKICNQICQYTKQSQQEVIHQLNIYSQLLTSKAELEKLKDLKEKFKGYDTIFSFTGMHESNESFNAYVNKIIPLIEDNFIQVQGIKDVLDKARKDVKKNPRETAYRLMSQVTNFFTSYELAFAGNIEYYKNEIEKYQDSLFGGHSGIMTEVNNFIESRIKGGACLKLGTVLILSALTSSFGGGIVGAMLGTAATNIVANAGDLPANRQWTPEDRNKFLTNVAVDTGIAWVGLMAGNLTTNLSTFSQLGTLVAADVATSVVGDIIKGEEITIEGIAYNLVLSTTGNFIGIAKCGNTTPGTAFDAQSDLFQFRQNVLNIKNGIMNFTKPIKHSPEVFTNFIDNALVALKNNGSQQSASVIRDSARAMKRMAANAVGEMPDKVLNKLDEIIDVCEKTIATNQDYFRDYLKGASISAGFLAFFNQLDISDQNKICNDYNRWVSLGMNPNTFEDYENFDKEFSEYVVKTYKGPSICDSSSSSGDVPKLNNETVSSLLPEDVPEYESFKDLLNDLAQNNGTLANLLNIGNPDVNDVNGVNVVNSIYSSAQKHVNVAKVSTNTQEQEFVIPDNNQYMREIMNNDTKSQEDWQPTLFNKDGVYSYNGNIFEGLNDEFLQGVVTRQIRSGGYFYSKDEIVQLVAMLEQRGLNDDVLRLKDAGYYT